MKSRVLSFIFAAILAGVLVLSGCQSKKSITVAVPNDPTNEARALMLFEAEGLLTLKEGAGITATKLDIADNPYGLEFKEMEAAQIPNVLQDVDYAVINSNYALEAGIDPMKQALIMEGAASPYANIIVVHEGNEEKPEILALVAAVESQKVADFITNSYNGSVVSVVANPTNGYDDSLDYAALAGTTITIAATPTPHCEILAIVKDILAEKQITLEVQEYTDYIVPNKIVDDGTVDANFFQHLPYLNDFNEQNNTKLVSVSAVHVEPMGLYSQKYTSLDNMKANKQG